MKFLLTFFGVLLCFSCKQEGGKEVKEKQVLVEKYSFSELEPLLVAAKHKPKVVNFWATWCAPCVEELPYFLKLEEKGLADVVLVSLDIPSMLNSHVVPFIEKNKIKSQVILLDDPYSNLWIPKINKNWSGAIPVSLIIAKDTSVFVSKRFAGYKPLAELVKKI